MTPTTEVLRGMIARREIWSADAKFDHVEALTDGERKRYHANVQNTEDELAALKSALADVERIDWLLARYFPGDVGIDTPAGHDVTRDHIDQARTAQDGGQGVGK